MTRSLVVVPTGTANTASVLAGFRRLGVSPRLASGAGDVERADRVILPGVGAFGAALAEVDRRGMRETLVHRIRAGLPTLAICVGMQLLASASEESDGAKGLGILTTNVARFDNGVRVPQLGWNAVIPQSGCRFVSEGWAYFANSYRITSIPRGWSGAMTDYGGTFVSALERGDILACQFHPELSGSWGSELLARWLASTGTDG